MTRTVWLTLVVLILVAGALLVAQEPGGSGERPVFRVKVDMVVLSFTVTDGKGKYVNGLKHSDFRVLEDGIPQTINTFSEGNRPPVEITASGEERPVQIDLSKPDSHNDAFVGTNVFVLFDTSNYMYRTFVYASDAIADFIRGLDRADSVAVYTYSRNLSRAADLTKDHNEAIFGLRTFGGRRRFGALQRAAAHRPGRRQGGGPQGGDRVLERSG